MIENTRIQNTTIDTADTVVSKKEFQLAKINQVLWFIIHLIGIIITLRFLFLLFGANLNGFALMIYNLSAPFVRVFQGIFPAPSTNGSYFDTAALLALAIWYILGFILNYVLSLFSNRVTEV
jgi:hypothetical protein